ncbi:MAG: hypothetical protein QW304_08755 [Thermoproteota archaeon]
MSYWVIQAPERVINLIKTKSDGKYSVEYVDKLFLILRGDISNIRPFATAAISITEHEFTEFINRQTLKDLKINQPVICTEGSYSGFAGVVAEIKPESVVVELSIFGAMNIVELSYNDIEPLDIVPPWDREEKKIVTCK